MNDVYPNYPPSYRTVNKIGGYHRSCFVVEVLSLEKLDNIQISMIQEHLESYLEQIRLSMTDLEKIAVINQSRFDPLVRAGLRI